MKQVDFYLISNQIDNAKYKLASRLANKLMGMQHGALLVTDSPEETAKLDRVMWSFSDASFLAHETISSVSADPQANCKIVIGEQAAMSLQLLEGPFEVLLNLCSTTPEFNHHFQRIAEIVEASDEAKAQARLRYKQYQTEGFEIKTHNIEL